MNFKNISVIYPFHKIKKMDRKLNPILINLNQASSQPNITQQYTDTILLENSELINAIVENMYLGRLSSGTTYFLNLFLFYLIRLLKLLYKNVKNLGLACDEEVKKYGMPQEVFFFSISLNFI